MLIRKRENLVVVICGSISIYVLSFAFMYFIESISGIAKEFGVKSLFYTAILFLGMFVVILPISFYRFYSKNPGSKYVEIERSLVLLGTFSITITWSLFLAMITFLCVWLFVNGYTSFGLVVTIWLLPMSEVKPWGRVLPSDLDLRL